MTTDILEDKVPTDIRRGCMIVGDMDVAMKIYHEILGLKFWYDEEMTVSGEGLPAGESNSKARLVILQGNDPLVGMMGFLEFLEPPLPTRTEYPKRLGIGDIIFVLNHEDVQSVYDQIKDIEDVHIKSEPHYVEFPAPNNGIYKRNCMSFFDPNGYFLEVVQLLN